MVGFGLAIVVDIELTCSFSEILDEYNQIDLQDVCHRIQSSNNSGFNKMVMGVGRRPLFFGAKVLASG